MDALGARREVEGRVRVTLVGGLSSSSDSSGTILTDERLVGLEDDGTGRVLVGRVVGPA